MSGLPIDCKIKHFQDDKLGELVPFLEDVLKHEFKTGWKHLLAKLETYFDEILGDEWKERAGVKYWW